MVPCHSCHIYGTWTSSYENLTNDQTYNHQYLRIANGILDLKKGFDKAP